MFAIAKVKLELNLLMAMPLATSIAIISTSLSTVQSQTINNSVEAFAQLPAETTQFSASTTPIPAETFLDAPQHQTIFPEPTNPVVVPNTSSTPETIAANLEELNQLQQAAPAPEQNITPAPIPGTVATEATILSAQPSAVSQLEVQTNTPEIAQLLPLAPGRSTRGGSSYVGIGGNIGLSGETALGDGNFTIISKIGLTRSLAVRPGVILGNDPVFLIPITYEFSIRPAEALETILPIAPYIGAGVTISTGGNNNDDIGLLLTGGIDVPLNRQFTANAALNVGIASDTDIGLSVGVGYNFSGFGL